MVRLRERLDEEREALSIGEALRLEKVLRRLEKEEAAAAPVIVSEAEAGAKVGGAEGSDSEEAEGEMSERRQAALRVMGERREGASED